MSSRGLAVSIPAEQGKFLDENPDLSPSKLIQSKIAELMENARGFEGKMRELNATNERLRQHRDKAIEFIEEKNLSQEFLQK